MELVKLAGLSIRPAGKGEGEQKENVGSLPARFDVSDSYVIVFIFGHRIILLTIIVNGNGLDRVRRPVT